MNVQLEIHLDEPIAEDGTSLLDLLVAKAGAQLLDQVKQEHPRLKDRVVAIRDEEIREALGAPIRAALTASLQPTNAFGERKGAEVTLREVIVQEAREQLKKSDRQQYPNRRVSLLHEILESEVERALVSELKEDLAAAKAEVRAAVREKGAEVIAEQIAGRLR